MDPNSVLYSQLRTFGSLIAGAAVAHGLISSGYKELAAGLIAYAAAAIWAWLTKRQAIQQKAATAAIALAMPPNAGPGALNRQLADTKLPSVDLTKA